MIDELIAYASKATGVTPEKTRLALSGALSLIGRHADQAKVTELFDALPGARELAAQAPATASGGGGLLGGFMKTVGGSAGKAAADGMAMLEQMKAAGISNGAMKKLVPAAIAFVEQRTGRDLMTETVRTIPGSGMLMGGKE